MPPDVIVRSTEAADLAALERLYPQAFPDEDLLAIVRALLAMPTGVISLAAMKDERIVGHIAFTQCALEGSAGAVYLLGPLAVAPSLQRRGIGQLLIGEGHARLQAVGASHVYVLGDPAYYAKSGFAAEQDIMPPYPLPPQWASAWQSQALSDAASLPSGTLKVPPVWDDPVLWQP